MSVIGWLALGLVLLGLPATGRAATATSVTQRNFTWTFSTSRTVGQYANGDWWVVGPVSIINITPASTVSGGRVMHGSMLNPVAGTSVQQGFDSDNDVSFNAALNVGRPGGSALSASNPLVITTGSLLSSQSIVTGGLRPQLNDLEILTVVSSVPPAGAFRPPYCGPDKTHRWTTGQLDYSALRRLAPVANTPSLATVENHFLRPWIEIGTEYSGRDIHPKLNMPDYGRDMAYRINDALLSLQLNYSDAQKSTLLIRMVQYGIDVYGAARSGGRWTNNGGHNQGRKPVLLLAARMLNDSNLYEYADRQRHFIFQDDQNYFYVSQTDVNLPRYTADGRPRDPYTVGMIGTPEWGEKHATQPQRDGANWGISYRSTSGSALVGGVLAVQLMGLKDAWNNPVVFDYFDERYVPIESPKAKNSFNYFQLFHRNMWQTYRGAAAATAVATPGILPGGGAFFLSQVVEITCSTPGAVIHYTTNGTMPTASSPIYLNPLQITSNLTVMAFARASGLDDSPVESARFDLGSSAVFVSGDNWLNETIPAQRGQFFLRFTMTPSVSAIDGVTGLSLGEATWYTDLAAIVRFNPSGQIDARNGSNYAAQNVLTYQADVPYKVEMSVDVPRRRYSVAVTPPGGSPVVIATDYAFRTEQANVSELNQLALMTLGESTHTISNLSILTAGAPAAPSGIKVSQQLQ